MVRHLADVSCAMCRRVFARLLFRSIPGRSGEDAESRSHYHGSLCGPLGMQIPDEVIGGRGRVGDWARLRSYTETHAMLDWLACAARQALLAMAVEQLAKRWGATEGVVEAIGGSSEVILSYLELVGHGRSRNTSIASMASVAGDCLRWLLVQCDRSIEVCQNVLGGWVGSRCR